MGLIKRQTTIEQNIPDDLIADTAPGAELLYNDLSSADTSVRRNAARSLSSRPEAIILLCSHLQSEPSVSVRSIIFTGLITHPSEAVVSGLLPLLRSEDAGLRNGAIEALQNMPNMVAPFLERVLVDNDSDVRIEAVNILGVLHHPSAPARLLRVVAEDSHVNVCAAALDALVEVGEPDAIPVLEGLVRRFPDVAFIQFAVAAAIRRIRGC